MIKLLTDRLIEAEAQRDAALDELSSAKTALRTHIETMIKPHVDTLSDEDTEWYASSKSICGEGIVQFFESHTGMLILHALELARRCATVDVHTGLPVEDTDELRATLDAILGEG